MLKQTKSPFFKLIIHLCLKNLLDFFANICLLDLRFPNLPKKPCQVEDIVGL